MFHASKEIKNNAGDYYLGALQKGCSGGSIRTRQHPAGAQQRRLALAAGAAPVAHII